MDEEYKRRVQSAVSCFLHCGDDYLFLKRSASKRIDPGRLNAVGGRVEPGENYLDAAIREVREETGYELSLADVRLCGVVRLEGGYEEDWLMCFFKAEVPTKEIPVGKDTEEGELMWIGKDMVLGSGHELVDDLRYCLGDITDGEGVFFMNARLDENERIVSFSKSGA